VAKDNDRDMSGVILITGGGRGIGAATARLAAERGLDVAVNFRSDRVAAQSTVDACVERGVRSAAFAADVAKERDVVSLFDAVEADLGGVSILVNNAGVLEGQMRFEEMSIERWRRVIDINVIGTFLCSREAVRRMSPRHGGSGGAIVNVSSAASYLGSPHEYVDYAATKGAVDSLTIGLAKEVAEDGIRVNAVRPGVIHTDIHASGGEPGRVERVAPSVPMRRGGDPEEVARTILWLASSDASYVTGALVNCTGGR
jgi:NAD(P)-dependent dehydrogenase (short-subunit alcohol dehydrogenase family)